MKYRHALMPLLAAAFLSPALAAQEPACTCAPAPGLIGVVFGWEADDDGRAVIRAVRPDGPAQRAGLREGNVVIRIDGAPATRAGVESRTARMRAGDTIRVRVLRDGAEQEVTIVAAPRVQVFSGRDAIADERTEYIRFHVDSLATRIDSLQRVVRFQVSRLDTTRFREMEVLARQMQLRAVEHDSLTRQMQARILESSRLRDGVRVFESHRVGEGMALPHFLELGARSVAGAEFAELNEGLSRYFDVGAGLLVLRVAPETPAARAGLEPGDVIVSVAGNAVTNQRQLQTTLAATEQGRVRLEIVRQGRRSDLQMEWQPSTVYRIRNTPGAEREIIIQRNENR
jgi:predicted metalloprotease with PDZ domain